MPPSSFSVAWTEKPQKKSKVNVWLSWSSSKNKDLEQFYSKCQKCYFFTFRLPFQSCLCWSFTNGSNSPSSARRELNGRPLQNILKIRYTNWHMSLVVLYWWYFTLSLFHLTSFPHDIVTYFVKLKKWGRSHMTSQIYIAPFNVLTHV